MKIGGVKEERVKEELMCVGYMKGKLKQYSTVKSSAELVLRIQHLDTLEVWIGERRNGSRATEHEME